MPQLLTAALILAIAWYGLKFFARASPAMVARAVRLGGGAVAGLTGLFLLLRGRPDLGIAGIGVGLWLAGFSGLPPRVALLRGFFARGASAGRSRARPTGRSQVRSAMIEMELDHVTGVMNGTILAGELAGRTLDTLTRPDCLSLHEVCWRDDPDGARLLEAYLDRRFPGWGETGQPNGDTRTGRRHGRAGSALSEEQAYEVLGLRKGATRDDVVRAHRTLMKKFHPDHGGATDHAARVNEAKEVLLRGVE